MAQQTTKTRKAQQRRPRLVPRTVTYEQLCDLPRDNVTAREWWMLTDSFRVTLTRQKPGECPTESVSVPRYIFDAFADWYMTGRWKTPRTRGDE